MPEIYTIAPNFIQVTIGPLVLWFSYSSVIAYRISGKTTTRISENAWGTTTGKHLNQLTTNKKDRIKREEFEAELREVMAGIKF